MLPPLTRPYFTQCFLKEVPRYVSLLSVSVMLKWRVQIKMMQEMAIVCVCSYITIFLASLIL